jgi:hypothetical protein
MSIHALHRSGNLFLHHRNRNHAYHKQDLNVHRINRNNRRKKYFRHHEIYLTEKVSYISCNINEMNSDYLLMGVMITDAHVTRLIIRIINCDFET